MSGPNHSRKIEMDLLAERIHREIHTWGVSDIKETDLSLIWARDEMLPDAEKRLSVENFSLQYGFRCVIDYGLACAVFRGSN